MWASACQGIAIGLAHIYVATVDAQALHNSLSSKDLLVPYCYHRSATFVHILAFADAACINHFIKSY